MLRSPYRSSSFRSPDSVSSPKHALVVGADGELAERVAGILAEWKIERAMDNTAALALVVERPFELILTGEETTAKTDIELLNRLRLLRPHIRLIILTSKSTPADVIASMKQRAFSYFSTPLSWEGFAQMLRLAADGPCWDDGIEVLSANPAWVRLAARCDQATADRLLHFFHEMAELPEPEKSDVASAFREMLLNAIEHGAHFDPTKYVEISYIQTRRIVICRVKDPGEGFSLAEVRHAAISNPPDDPIRHHTYRESQGLRPGGFGLLLSQSLVDDVVYTEKGNEVLLIKSLASSSPTSPVKGFN
jgi:anti-sigma regulatory factor (Ser/Thr protein kinase)